MLMTDTSPQPLTRVHGGTGESTWDNPHAWADTHTANNNATGGGWEECYDAASGAAYW